MASNENNIDYLLKLVGYNIVKTDKTGGTVITVPNETNFTSTVVKSDDVWLESQSLIDTGIASPVYSSPSGSVNGYVKMTSIHAIGSSQDYPTLIGYAWTSSQKNWISPSYNSAFAPTFRVTPRSSTDPTTGTFYTIATNTTYPFIFDYKSGILVFTGTPAAESGQYNLGQASPAGPPFYTPYDIWIKGYVYTGKTLQNSTSFGATGPQGPTGPYGPPINPVAIVRITGSTSSATSTIINNRIPFVSPPYTPQLHDNIYVIGSTDVPPVTNIWFCESISGGIPQWVLIGGFTSIVGPSGNDGPTGATGPIGPTGPSLLMQFDGGVPSTFTALTVPNPNLDCGRVV